jgi:hypothetical protein
MFQRKRYLAALSIKDVYLMVSVKKNERPLMSDLYAMQRANGDVFALDDHGRFRVPLFHSTHDAMMARLRNLGMLLFKPVALDARLLKEIVPVGGAAELDFWLVNDPLINLKRGRLVQPAQLALLVGNPIQLKAVPRNATTVETTTPSTSLNGNSKAPAVWEDEGGLDSKCA